MHQGREIIASVHARVPDAQVQFDAAAWFRQASNSDITALYREGSHGPAALAVAKWCWDEAFPNRKEAMNAIFGDGPEAFVEPISMTLWLLRNRGLLAITLCQDAIQEVRDLIKKVRAGVFDAAGDTARAPHCPDFDHVVEIQVGYGPKVVVPYHDLAVMLVEMEREPVAPQPVSEGFDEALPDGVQFGRVAVPPVIHSVPVTGRRKR